MHLHPFQVAFFMEGEGVCFPVTPWGNGPPSIPIEIFPFHCPKGMSNDRQESADMLRTGSALEFCDFSIFSTVSVEDGALSVYPWRSRRGPVSGRATHSLNSGLSQRCRN